MADAPVIVIGAGPAGLTAAYELVKRGVPVVVFDDDTQPGGLARTVVYKDFRFDIGGHRFFTKVQPVVDLWHEWLGKDLLKRPRLSRIYYRGKFFSYPLRPVNALMNLGIGTSIMVLISYAWARVNPVKPEVSFEDWVSNRFGRKLYLTFFKSYTEKVWGIPCSTIEASWAAQRIQGLSLVTAILGMFKRTDLKTLIHEFEYPRLGPGMMWEACQALIEAKGGAVHFKSRVVGIETEGQRVTGVTVLDASGEKRTHPASHVISTMPMRHLLKAFSPSPPANVIAAADRLKYRDFITVAIILDEVDVFPDNWIYVHDPDVKVGRIQNFKNWSPEMVPDQKFTCLGLEYFCSEGDELWEMSDADLLATARRELAHTGIARAEKIVDGMVLRVRKAYPVYDAGYSDALEVLKTHLAPYSNLLLVGRNGMHKYNNQDHSMLTAMLAVRNLFGEQHDLWAVNADEAFHEAGPTASEAETFARQLRSTEPPVPKTLDR